MRCALVTGVQTCALPICTGSFGTDATDLAAAFGPVQGLATEIHFTDLLNMVSAPGQTATIASVNPGVAATDGVIRYRLLGPTQVQIDGGRWPFRSEEHTPETQYIMRITYAVFCLTKTKTPLHT